MKRYQDFTFKKGMAGLAIIAFLVLAVIAVKGDLKPFPSKSLTRQSNRAALLKEHFLNDSDVLSIQAKDNIVFISISDTKSRALVFTGKGSTIAKAWAAADRKAGAHIGEHEGYNAVWVKADIVNATQKTRTADLNRELASVHFKYFYRKGIALDDNFDTAFLEAEVNGNKMIAYPEQQQTSKSTDSDSVLLNKKNINHYLESYYGREPIKNIPDEVTTFTTLGFFCDEQNNIYPLYGGGLDYGRRTVDLVDDDVISEVILNASTYLYRQLDAGGHFTYGHFPIFDNTMTGYNIVRHTTAIWSLINLYRMTNDTALVPRLDSAIAYLLKGFIEYKSAGVAYVVERGAGEIKLGGNGVAIIMLSEYMDVFGTDKYAETVAHLANGILELENLKDGTYYHVLNYPGFSRKEKYRIIYYDGEATFGLIRAYAFTKDKRYLAAAAAAVEHFIKSDYTGYRDHWVAYAMNEITKYIREPRYYEFALKNVQNNLKAIYNRETSFHTYLELLMVGWQTYRRIVDSGMPLDYLNGFDVKRFSETIYKRARHMLNGYFYPEYAMYMKAPDKIVHSFFVRHHDYRVRIDDVQHFIGGYYYYTLYFDDIVKNLSDEFLKQIESKGFVND
ncbi:hypothetical protein Barb7_01634 [Bacteroidales bacterium Barb7]|nr:hypothetical protein Barb7_01634 [Bacteroidales bacterium Barb7]